MAGADDGFTSFVIFQRETETGGYDCEACMSTLATRLIAENKQTKATFLNLEIVLIASSEGSLIGPDGLVKELTKAPVKRMLAGELNHHLGYEKHDVANYGNGNPRNGKSQKTLKKEAGEMKMEVPPRDRTGTFEPKLTEKHQTRFDAKILSMRIFSLGTCHR